MMTNRDRARRIGETAVVCVVAAALSAAAVGVARSDDKQAPAANPAAPAPPAATAGQQAPQQPQSAQPPPQAQPPQQSAAPSAPAGVTSPAAAPPVTAAPADAASPQPPAAENKSGFFQEIGRWWNDSMSKFGSNMKDAQQKFSDFNKSQRETAKEAMKSAAEATKDAATAIVRLPGTRAVEVHEPCPKAPNGAPDCQETANNACRGKGFNTGKPLDVSSSEKCVTTMWLSGQSQGECRLETETILARALCQ